jgi:integrase
LHELGRALVLVAGYGGLRIGELAGLRRSRVDLLRGTITVAEIVVEVRGVLHIGPPKTRASRRTVGLPRFVAEELAAHLAEPGDRRASCSPRPRWPAAGDRVPRSGVAPGHQSSEPGQPAHP